MTDITILKINKENSLHCIFGFKLTSIRSKTLVENPERLMAKHQLALSNFINMLYDPDRDITYTLRYIIDPDEQYYSLGSIELGLLVKVVFPDPDTDVRLAVNDLAKVIKPLLGSSFSEYTWKEIATQNELNYFMNPIEWDSASIAEIRRREETIYLDTFLPQRSLGFTPQPTAEEHDKAQSLSYVHPFTAPLKGFQRILKTLLQGNSKTILTTILKPTVLSDDEKDLLYKQISYCESTDDSSQSLVRVQRRRAEILGHGLLRQYLSLQDAPFYMTFTVASETRLDRINLEMIGLGITEPVGQNVVLDQQLNNFAFHIGGYDVVLPRSDSERSIARENMLSLSQALWQDNRPTEVSTRLRFLFDGNEAISAFYLPINVEEDIPGLNTHYLAEQAIPREMMEIANNGGGAILLGSNHYYGFEQDVVVSEAARRQHTYIIGQTGTGKTTLMKTMILSDLKAGSGLAVIDPHGELYEDLLSLIPEERKEDVVLFNPSDTDYPVGFNLLQVSHDDEREAIIKEMRAILKRYIFEYFQIQAGEYAGPVFFQHMQNNMLLASSDIDNPGTILEVSNIFLKDKYWKRWLPLKWKNHVLEDWVTNHLPKTNYLGRTSDGGISGDYFSSKIADFTNDPRISMIFGQPFSTINIEEIIASKKILLVNLSKGLLGEASASLLGMILMAKFNTAFMERRKHIKDDEKLSPFYLYVDEFQNLATENFSILLSEARKFGLGLILANQFISQIKDYKIKEAIFGNVGTLISFRLGFDDAQVMGTQFLPHYGFQELCNLPNYNAIIRTNIEGRRTIPCNFHTNLPDQDNLFCDKTELTRLSRQKYSLPGKLAEFVVQLSLSDQRIKKTQFYFEKDSTPQKERLINCDISAAFCVLSLGLDEYKQKIDRLFFRAKAQSIYYLLYEKHLSSEKVANIYMSLSALRSEEFFNDKASLINLLSKEQPDLEHDFIGLLNFLIVQELISEIDRLVESLKSDAQLNWLKEILNLFESDRWSSVIKLIKANTVEIAEILKEGKENPFISSFSVEDDS